MWLQKTKSGSIIDIVPSHESVINRKPIHRGLIEQERESLIKETGDNKYNLEDHLFCAFIGNFAQFKISEEKEKEKPEIKYVDCFESSEQSLLKDDDVSIDLVDTLGSDNLTINSSVKETSKKSISISQKSLTSKKSVDGKVNRKKSVTPLTKQSASSISLIKKKISGGNFNSKRSTKNRLPEYVMKVIAPDIEVEDKKSQVSERDPNEINYEHIYLATGERYDIIKFIKSKLLYDFLNGNKFEGQIDFGGMDGYGTYSWNNGSKYKGRFMSDIENGQGYLEWPDQSCYDGTFLNGLRNGSGSYTIRVNEGNYVYTGSWLNGEQSGKGTFKYNDNNWYEGDFKHGTFNGKGLRKYCSGNKYLGEWKNGLQNGTGVMLYLNNDMYSGDWVNGMMEGHGKYIWDTFLNTQFVFPMHNAYIGHWKNGRRNGFGSLILSSGGVLTTEWKDGKKNGWGKITCTNGSTIESDKLFANDNLVGFKQIVHRYEYPKKTKEEYAKIKYTDDIVEKESIHRLLLLGVDSSMDNQESVTSALEDCINSPYKPGQTPVNLPTYFMNLDCHVSKFFTLNDWYERIMNIDWCQWSLDLPLNIKKATEAVITETGEIKSTLQTDIESYSFKDSLQRSPSTDASKSSFKQQKCINYIQEGKRPKSTYLRPLNNLGSYKTPKKDLKLLIKDVYLFEKKWLRNSIIKYMPLFNQIYYKYATICCKDKPEFQVGLIRILLWKLLRQIKFSDTGLSIIEIDYMAGGSRNPFDYISLSEMIHYLLLLSWQIYTQTEDVNSKVPGMLAGAFEHFIQHRIQPLNNQQYIYEPLFLNCEMIPLESLYKLFKSLGKNITVKYLVKMMTKNVNKLHDNDKHTVIDFLPRPDIFFSCNLKGYNMILPGGDIIYKVNPVKSFDCTVENATNPPINYDSVGIEFFSTLGTETILNCVVTSLPYICNSKGQIKRNEYQICFLEFLDIFSACLDVYLTQAMKYKQDTFDNNKINILNKCMGMMLNELDPPAQQPIIRDPDCRCIKVNN